MDRALLLAARGTRAFGFGFAAVLIGVHLERRGLSPALIGLTLGVALAAASLSGLASAALSSRIGRRQTLVVCGFLMALTGLDLASATNPFLLVGAGLTGMLGAASIDLGPFASVEQAMLAEAVPAGGRNVAFARYSLIGGLFNAAGGLSATLATSPTWTPAFFLFYAGIGLVTALVPMFMSKRVESPVVAPAFGSFRPLAGLAALFALDSLGGGFVANAVIAYWLHVRFGADPSLLGPVFAGVAVLQAISYELSGRLSSRFGLINTMVFTHLPSNLLLAAIPLAPTFPLALALLFARFALSQMDVPTRQAYVLALVDPEERTAAIAFTNTARYVVRPLAPVLAGFAQQVSLGLPFVLAGSIKAGYDLVLWASFHGRAIVPTEAESRQEGRRWPPPQ